MPVFLLGLLFFIVALLYAAVGFGGGSSYLALLILWRIDYASIPIIALICNVVVVSGNSVNYVRKGYLKSCLITPLAISSVPFSYLGGSIKIGKEEFITILICALAASGIRLLLTYKSYDDNNKNYRTIPILLTLIIGSSLGLLAGITGIGGGIFLAPILYYFRVGAPKQIAATASMFILINSISGILGQISKGNLSDTVLSYWYLPLFALIGGQIGNLFVIKFVPARIVAMMTSLLILFVSANLAYKAWF